MRSAAADFRRMGGIRRSPTGPFIQSERSESKDLQLLFLPLVGRPPAIARAAQTLGQNDDTTVLTVTRPRHLPDPPPR
jgi:hypothetical protein